MTEDKDTAKNRFKFLHRLHEISGGYEYTHFNMIALGQELGFDEILTSKITAFLQAQELIELEGSGLSITITDYGIHILEKALADPDKDIWPFPPVNEMLENSEQAD